MELNVPPSFVIRDTSLYGTESKSTQKKDCILYSEGGGLVGSDVRRWWYLRDKDLHIV